MKLITVKPTHATKFLLILCLSVLIQWVTMVRRPHEWSPSENAIICIFWNLEIRFLSWVQNPTVMQALVILCVVTSSQRWTQSDFTSWINNATENSPESPQIADANQVPVSIGTESNDIVLVIIYCNDTAISDFIFLSAVFFERI